MLPEGYPPGSKLRLSVDDSPVRSSGPATVVAKGAGDAGDSSGGQAAGAAAAPKGGPQVIDISDD